MEQETHVDSVTPLSSEAALILIKAIQSGNRAALATLYDRTSRLLFGLVLRILPDRVRAEETLLDIYTHIWKQSAFYSPGLLPLEWLTSIARACAMSRLHWGKPDIRRQELPSSEFDPKMTVAPEEQGLARSSIQSLVSAQREILDWAYYSGLSCGEIAAQVGKPLGAVKNHARHGLSKLSELFHPLFEREMDPGIAVGGHNEARTSD